MSALALQLPQHGAPLQGAAKVFQENVSRLGKYLRDVLSPATVAAVIRDVNQWAADSGKPCGRLVTQDDLRRFIRSNKCTCELGGAQAMP